MGGPFIYHLCTPFSFQNVARFSQTNFQSDNSSDVANLRTTSVNRPSTFDTNIPIHFRVDSFQSSPQDEDSTRISLDVVIRGSPERTSVRRTFNARHSHSKISFSNIEFPRPRALPITSRLHQRVDPLSQSLSSNQYAKSFLLEGWKPPPRIGPCIRQAKAR